MRVAGKVTQREIWRRGLAEWGDWTPKLESHLQPQLFCLHRLSASRLETREAKTEPSIMLGFSVTAAPG